MSVGGDGRRRRQQVLISSLKQLLFAPHMRTC